MRAEKKALKKKKKTRGADKRKADEDDEKEWGDEEEGNITRGQGCTCVTLSLLTLQEWLGFLRGSTCTTPAQSGFITSPQHCHQLPFLSVVTLC